MVTSIGHYVEGQYQKHPFGKRLLAGPYEERGPANDERDLLAPQYPDCTLRVVTKRGKSLPAVKRADTLQRGAVLAFDDRLRLLLERVVPGAGEPRTAAWLMCNPSTADALGDDPTAGRVVSHSLNAGCRRSLVGNVWGWRTPLPSELWMALDDHLYHPGMNSANLDALAMIGAQADVHVVAFGVAPGRMYRDQVMRALEAFAFGPLYCLGTSEDGWPLHPLARGKLAIASDVQLTPWEIPAA